MVEVGYLASALLMGLLLAVVLIGLSRNTRVSVLDESSDSDDRQAEILGTLSKMLQKPSTWIIGFILLTGSFMGGVLLFVGGGPIPDSSREVLILITAGLAIVIFTLFLFIGTYATATSKGRSTARSVAEGLTALSILFMIAIVANLIIS